MPKSEQRQSPRERKLGELVQLAQLQRALEPTDNATREHGQRVTAALQMLELMQREQAAQAQQALREREFEQTGRFQQRQLDDAMLARAGVASSEAATRGIALAQDRENADRKFKQDQERDKLQAALEMFKTMVGAMDPSTSGGFSMNAVDQMGRRLAPDIYGAASDAVGVAPKPPTPEEVVNSIREAIQKGKPEASVQPVGPIQAERPPDPVGSDPRSGWLQIGPPMPDNPMAGTTGFMDALMKGNITAANAHLANRYVQGTKDTAAGDSRLTDWLRLTYNLQ